MDDAWRPDQYGKFAVERAQPFWDLLDLVERSRIRRAVDLGCGTGELTEAAATRLAVEDMTGIDSSPSMLEQAKARSRPGLRFAGGDIGSWSSGGGHDLMDLVLANASVHWVPDHVGVLTRWWAAIAPGGQLAVQMPANADHASHRVAGKLAATEPFRSALGGTPPPDPVAANVLAPEQYAILLDHLGAARQHVRLQVYPHVLASSADVVEWVKGTSLTRFFHALPAELHEPFVAEYRRRLLDAIGDRAPYFYPFKRILFWASKPPGR
jgi:trans-aconitate 2-methyltransferase